MKARKLRTYTKFNQSTGTANDVFVYTVHGTEKEIAAYKADQGENLRHLDDDSSKAPLFFTTRFAGASVDLVKTKSGRYVADMSALKEQASLVRQFGGNLGQAIAQQCAAQFLFGGNTPAPKAIEASEETPEVVEEPKAETENIDEI